MAVTPIAVTPPLAATSTRVWSRSYVHGAPSWISSSCVPSTVSEPRRASGVPLALTLNGIVAEPWPLDRSGAIQDAVDVMLHVHSRAPSTARLPEPAVYGNNVGASVAETSHFPVLGAVVELEDDVHPLMERTSPAIAARRSATTWRMAQAACQSVSST
jgi:hypothetical protein